MRGVFAEAVIFYARDLTVDVYQGDFPVYALANAIITKGANNKRETIVFIIKNCHFLRKGIKFLKWTRN